MKSEDLSAKPYARFWRPQMAQLSPACQQALTLGAQPTQFGFASRDLGQFAGHSQAFGRTGYTRLPDQQLFVTVHTPMPGVSGAMLDWWFGWHGGEPQRYKLWHPLAHAGIRMKYDRATAACSDRERYIGNPSYVTEYIGGSRMDLTIAFVAPERFGLSDEHRSQARITAAIAAQIAFTPVPIYFGKLLHVLREGHGPSKEDSEMQSYFWLGDVGRLTPLIAPVTATKQKAVNLLRHCAEEMHHLASFLPELHALYHRP